jgi:hypothetical protein
VSACQYLDLTAPALIHHLGGFGCRERFTALSSVLDYTAGGFSVLTPGTASVFGTMIFCRVHYSEEYCPRSL